MTNKALTKIVETLDGYNITCRYLTHPAFDFENSLSEISHHMFLLYASERSYSSACNLRLGIEHFHDFKEHYNYSNPEGLKINSITDLSLERLNEFFRYLKKNRLGQKSIEALRNGFSFMTELDAKFPVITFPTIPNITTKPTEPLSEEAIDALEKGLKKQIDEIREKIEFRKEVKNSVPYSYEEVLESINPSCSKRNIYLWYRFMLEKHNYKRANIGVKRKLTNGFNVDIGLKALLAEEQIASAFHELYEKEGHLFINDDTHNPFEQIGIRTWLPDYKRALKTLINEGYPFQMDFEECKTINTANLKSFEACTDITRIIFHRFTQAKFISKKRENSGIPIISLDELLSLYYPAQIDTASLMLFIQLQTGWNKETVVDLDRHEYCHVLSGVIDETQQLIFSEKYRSQNLNVPYFKPKEMLAVSSTKDKYSAINLIKLADELSQPFHGNSLDMIPLRAIRINELFFCKNDIGDWSETGRMGTLSNVKTSVRGVKDFLKKFKIIDKGKELTKSGELVKRLRTTWVYLKRKSSPLSMVSMQLGHASEQTTDIYYDNSNQARIDRKEKLKNSLNSVMDQILKRQFKGLLPNEQTAKTKKNDSLVIFTIPGHEKPMWGCKEQFSPDWAGHEKFINENQKCFYINHCIKCSQIELYEDSLPYLLDRLEYLEYSEREIPSVEFNQLYSTEIEILRWVIDNWNDDDAIKSANRYLKRNRPLLPKDLASLITLFGDIEL